MCAEVFMIHLMLKRTVMNCVELGHLQVSPPLWWSHIRQVYYGPGTVVSKLMPLQLQSLSLVQAPSKARYLILWTVFLKTHSSPYSPLHPLPNFISFRPRKLDPPLIRNIYKCAYVYIKYIHFSFILMYEIPLNLSVHKIGKLRGWA